MNLLRLYSFNCILFALVFCFTAGSLLAQGTLSGTVKDTNGKALTGTTIAVKGTTTGTIAGIDGSYSLTVAAGSQIIVYSFIGYRTYELSITVEDGTTYTQDIVLSSDELSLDEVVVTGSFSGKTQKESPMSITILNGARLQQLTSNSQADILRTVPGITAEGGGGEVASNVFVRGMPSGGQYQFTPLQVDGLPVLSTFGLNSSAHDVYFRNDIGLRNLEFVRGGISTLFGAGSVAGIINYTSATGTAEQDNKFQMEWAQGGRMKLDFLTSGQSSENLFYAFSGFYRYDEGPLQTGLPTRGSQIRGNLKRLFNNGKSSFTIYGQYINDNVQFYLPYPLLSKGGNTRERPKGNDGEVIYTMLTGQAKDFSFNTPFGRFKSPIGNGVTTKGGYLMFALDHSFGNDWSLSGKFKVASYNHWFNLFLDGDGTHNTPETQASYLKDRSALPSADSATFTYVDDGTTLKSGDLLFENRILDRQRPMQEMVAQAYITKTINVHNISIGTFLSNTRAEDNNWLSRYVGDFRNAPRMVNITYKDTAGNDVNYSPGGFISGNQTSNRYHESSKIAFFFGDEIKTDNFNLDIGLRWENASGIISRETGVGSNTFQKAQVSANDIAIALAGLYKVNSALGLYGNFSRGYFFPELRSVKFSSAGKAQTYKTESILQGELGAKYGQGNLSGTLAAFYVALSDRRSVDFVNSGGNIIEQVKVQSTQTIGVEMSFNYTITQGLNAYGNFTYQDHKFTKVEGNTDQEGNKLRRQPNIMGMLGVSYDHSKFDANLSSNFLGNKFANDANTVELEGFNIMRLDAGYKFSLGERESLRLGLSVFNLLDAAGITEGSPRQGDAQTGTSEYFVGRPILPRRIFIRATFDF